MNGVGSLVQRWQRAELHVRCGLAPREPAYLQLYLHMGRKLARRDDRPALAVQLRMLSTLLKSAKTKHCRGSGARSVSSMQACPWLR